MEHLEIQIAGKIQNTNFPIWENSLLKQINSINMELITDDDFAIATEDAKLLKSAEKAIQEAKIKAIEQTEEIQLLFKALDEISEKARQSRLTLERQIRIKKQEIKNELISTSITRVIDHIDSKPQICTQLDNSKHLQRHLYEFAIKGKSSIVGIRKALKSLVQNFKNTIDQDCNQALRNYELIETIPTKDRLLFQDINYLVTLPEKELRLIIENRIVKLSEQKAKTKAANAEKELHDIDNEVLLETNEVVNRYVISIELLSTRQTAISKAREINSLFDNSDCLVDMKLAIKRDQQPD